MHKNNVFMDTVKIKDKSFRVSIPEAEIKERVKALAEQMSKDLEGKNPIFLGVLNGSFIFAADLMREMTVPCEISFVKLASYQGTTSTGKVREVLGINENLSGRTVLYAVLQAGKAEGGTESGLCGLQHSR